MPRISPAPLLPGAEIGHGDSLKEMRAGHGAGRIDTGMLVNRAGFSEEIEAEQTNKRTTQVPNPQAKDENLSGLFGIDTFNIGVNHAHACALFANCSSTLPGPSRECVSLEISQTMQTIILSIVFAAGLFGGILVCMRLGSRVGRNSLLSLGEDGQAGLGAIDSFSISSIPA